MDSPAFPKPTRTPKVRKPLRRRNPKRARARQERNFGARAAVVRKMRCSVPTLFVCSGCGYQCGTRTPCAGPIEAAHVKSRGAGGDRRDLVPLCQAHHREQHTLGVKGFNEAHSINLRTAAAALAADLDKAGLP